MATVDKLVVRIEADMKDLKAKLKSAQTQTKATTASMKASFAQLKTSVGGVGRSIFSLKGALVGLGVGAGIKSLISVGSSVESLQIRFETLFGSAEEGSKAFETMASFASKVPFSLAQIQQGSGSLIAVAKNAEELGELLKITGTIAAATGLDFNTASQQIQRSLSAGIGAADLFRDRGVTAMLGFKAGAQVTVAETREAFEKFADENEGITDRLAGTFQGTLSMIGDSVFNFQRVVNDAGFFSELTAHFAGLRDSMNENKLAITEFAEDLSGRLVNAMKLLTNVMIFVAKNMDLILLAFKAFIFLKVSKMIGGIIIAMNMLKIAIFGATAAQIGLNVAMRANIIGAVITGLLLLSEVLFGAISKLLGFNDTLKEAEDQSEKTADSIHYLTETTEKLVNGSFSAMHGLNGINTALRDQKKRIAEANNEFSQLIANYEKETFALRLNAQQKEIQKALDKQGVNALSREGLALIEVINKKHEEIKAIADELAIKNLRIEIDKEESKIMDDTIKKQTAIINSNNLLNAELMGANEIQLARLKIAQDNADLDDAEIKRLQDLAELNIKLKNAIAIKTKSEKDADILADKLQSSQQKATDQIKGLINENILLDAELKGLNETQLLQLAIRQQLTGATDDQIKKLDELIKKNLELKDQISTKEKNEETVTKKKEDDDQAVLDLVDDLGLLDDAQKDYTDSVQLLRTAMSDGTINSAQYAEGLLALKMTLLESTEEGKIAIEGLERVQDLLFDSMADALTGAEGGWKSFRDSLKNIIRDIIADLLKLQAKQAIMRAFGGGGSSGGGGGFDLGKIISMGSSFFGGGGSGGGSFAGPSSMGSGGYGSFANGGSVTGNQPAMVGERGPELFVPHTSGGIFTNRSLKNSSGGGGATVNQTINIETGVSQTVRAEMASLLPQIKQESVNAVMDAKKRGGQMADTFS